ncbi:MAG: hypothetical protein AB1445_09695 [Bacillota bacterium]
MVTEGRWYAHQYLEQEAAAHAVAAQELRAASRALDQEHRVGMDMRQAVAAPTWEGMARKLARQKVSREVAVLVRKAGEPDRTATGHLERALLLL